MDNGPRTSDAPVLYQAVPKPRRPVGGDTRALREHLVIGRICTPVARKWPGELPAFYERLAGLFPRVEWEFVGCPSEVHPPLAEACHGRAAFFPASWDARARLWRWDALLYHNPHVTESFGRTAAEAMRAGCIPIVDAAGGFVEQVVEGCGLLCASAEEFAAAIERLHDPGERRGMSRRALAHADGVFSIERHGREVLSVLSAVT
jgi:glycosyltransferase involved in cell wall biosynthesis